MDLEIRAERPDDVEHVHAVVRDAFSSDEEPDLVAALRTDPTWIGDLSVVGAIDSRVVAHVLLTRCHIDGVPALALAPCSVAPEHQRRGVGTAVIEAALTRARELSERTVVVLGHPDYYPRFGFTPAVEAGVRLSVPVPEEALKVLALDPATPVPSGLVAYPAPFGI